LQFIGTVAAVLQSPEAFRVLVVTIQL